MKELFIYIDPGFLESAGHYTTLARNIREVLKRNGADLWHFVSNDVSNASVRKYKLERLFHHKAILTEIDQRFTATVPVWKLRVLGAVKVFLDPIRSYVKKHSLRLPVAYPPVLEQRTFVKSEEEAKLEAFRSSLEMVGDRIIAKGYDDRKATIFMYNCHPLYFPIFAEVFSGSRYSSLRLTIHLNLFYLNPEFCRGEPADEYKSLLKTVGYLLEWRDPAGRINLYSDSERTISAYRKYFRRVIKLLPVPVLSDDPDPLEPDRQPVSNITIGFFGYPSRKQGYHLVKRLYESIVGQERFGNVRFIVRHNESFATAEMGDVMREFRKTSMHINHLTGFLTHDEYQKSLSGCDIVLIPHSRLEYPTQTSGLFVEALGAGKIIVAPQNTWMADQLRSFGAGQTFDSESYESFEKAATKAILDFPSDKNTGLRGISEVRRIHSASNLLEILAKNESPVVVIPDNPAPASSNHAFHREPASPFRKLKNLHKGQRCFIVGNGPSLNAMNLELLSQEYTICSNAFFLMFPKISWRPQYFTAVDTRVVPDRARDILRMHEENPEMMLFFPADLVDHQTGLVTPTGEIIPPSRNRYYFTQKYPDHENLPFSAFSYNPEEFLVQPYTVTVTALQLAAYLGFDPIYLIGCDSEYKVPASVQQEGDETTQGKMFFTSTEDDDTNHFDPSYFGKGRKWHNPQVENMFWHYKMAHEALAILGRRVYNAGVGGKLEVFPRVDFEKVVE